MAASKKTRGLGKGLDALFGDAEVTLQSRAEKNSKNEDEKTEDPKQKVDKNERTGGGIDYIDINDIKPNSNQPRKTFDEDKLNELAASIEEHGLIQPLVLRKAEKGYEIVAGERRWRAARKIGIREIPCIVRELTDEENMLLAIIENMQREDLNPIEEAEGIRQMIETYGLTQEEVSKSVGKSRPYIANSLRLLRLTETVRKYIEDGSLSTGHAKAIAAVSDEKKQIELAEVAIRDGLSVRQLEKLAQQDKSGVKTRSRVKQKTADVKRVEEDLKNALGTKVTLNQKGKKGKIEIEFYSKDELERLIELLKKLG
ncbi:MAG: ParB/RepB/Spo0J family partition protein [Clostridiales bacterium]|nr:ParB/RepB/Spo0J family partition protein [Clostridiales bacterium]